MFRGPPPCPEFLPSPQPGAVLRPTSHGHCHWVWRDEVVGDAVRDWGSFGPVAEVTAALRRLGPTAHLVDVGTNVGLVSAAALASGHDVTCFEAEAHNVALWRATLALNNWTTRATVVDRAVVANSTEERSVGFRRWDVRNRGGSRIVRGTKRDSHTPTTHLDLWASRLPRGTPVVMKLDIEGCEHGALRGARRHMLPRVRALFTEISPRAMAACGGNASQYVNLLRRQGFEVRRRGGERALHAEILDAQAHGRIIDAAFWRPADTMAGRLGQMLGW